MQKAKVCFAASCTVTILNKNDNIKSRRNLVGGQAVIEGVMMKSGENYALAVRTDDGNSKVSTKKITSLRKKYKILNLPLIRGVVNMVESLILSYSTLSDSLKMLGIDEFEEETELEKWLKAKVGFKLVNIIMGVAMVFAVVLAIFLFKLVPAALAKVIDEYVVSIGVFKSVIEGAVKIGIFVLYIWVVSFMKDIRRTFEYHGAEHKSIACFESGDELTPANAKKHTRFHPRCGTSFIFVVLLLSIIIFSFIPWGSLAVRMLLQLLLLPLLVGLSFEFIMYAGRHDNIVTKILSAPGLWMQRLTTKEPDEAQLEIAILALKRALPDMYPEEVGNTDGACDEINNNGEEDTFDSNVTGEDDIQDI